MSYFAEHLKALRTQSNLSMQELADLANVSKSTISKIEREEVQPTIDIAARLAQALGKTLSEMLHAAQSPQIIHLPKEEQAIWEDARHIKRRNISPIFENLKIEWLHVTLPAQTTLKCEINALTYKGEKYVLVVKGTLEMKINQMNCRLKKGDSLYFDASCEHEFINSGKDDLEYYIVVKHD